MGWQNYGDVWMNDETGEISETDPTPPAPAAVPAPAPTATAPSSALRPAATVTPAAAPTADPAPAPAPTATEAIAPEKLTELPGARPGITAPAGGRPTPLPTAPHELALAEQESSAGKAMHQYKPDADGVVSGGSYGFRGDTVKSLLKSNPHLRSKYPELMQMSYDGIANFLNHHPDADDDLFRTAYPPILEKHKGDPHAAYAEWNGGPVAGAAWDKASRGEPLTDAEQRKLDAVRPNVAEYDQRLAKLQSPPKPEAAPGAPADAPAGFQPVYPRGADAPKDLAHFDASTMVGDPATAAAPVEPGEIPHDSGAILDWLDKKAAYDRYQKNLGAIAAGPAEMKAGGGLSNLAALAPGKSPERASAALAEDNFPVPASQDEAKSTLAATAPSAAPREDAKDPQFNSDSDSSSSSAPAQSPLQERLSSMYDDVQRDIDDDKTLSAEDRATVAGLLKDVQDAKVQPNHLWASMSTPQRILAAISMGLGAAGASLTHSQNTAAQIIQEAIADDMRAQEAEVGKKVSLYSETLKATGNKAVARKTAIMAKIKSVQSMDKEASGGAMKPTEANQFADIDEGIAQLEEYQKKLNAGYSGPIGSALSKVPWGKTAAAAAQRPTTSLAVARAEHPGRAPGSDYVKMVDDSLPGPGDTVAMQKAKIDAKLEQLKRDRANRLALMKNGGTPSAAPSTDDKPSGYTDVDDEDN